MFLWVIIAWPFLCCLYVCDWCVFKTTKGKKPPEEEGIDEFDDNEQSQLEDDLVERIKDDKAEKYRISDESGDDSERTDKSKKTELTGKEPECIICENPILGKEHGH